MKRSKGAGVLAVSAIVIAAVAAILILVVANNASDSITDVIRLDTVGIVAQRVDTAIYTTSALDTARVELDLDDTYGVGKEDGKVKVNYTVGSRALPIFSKTSSATSEPPVEFSVENEKVTQRLCLVKNPGSDVVVKPGGCE